MTMRRKLTTALIAVLLGVVPGIVALRAQAPAGPREGIVVHGHWIIDVREPNGRLVSHREFENALTGGGSLLAEILSRRNTMGHWSIVLGSSAGGGPCFGQVGGVGNAVQKSCQINEVGQPTNGGVDPATLTLAASGLTLTGSVTAGGNSPSIDFVRTVIFPCPSNVLPAACAAITNGVTGTGLLPVEFSSANITPPQGGLVAGQTIQVTVTFTFS